jgi:phenylpropionate dioxygenase-like ring-hydroxylating dioxygenase large terminal subunit
MQLLHAAPPAELIDQFCTFYRRQWNPIARVNDLSDGHPLAATLLDQPLVVARLDGTVVVMDDVCRHFQAALSLGEVDRLPCGRPVLRCKYHGWAYDAGGKCVEIPQLDAGRSIPAEARVRSYPAVVKHGIVWTSLDPEPGSAVPEMFVGGASDLRVLDVQVTRWDCSAVRMILSTMDDYHLAFLHEGILGDRSHPHAPTRVITREGTALVSRYTVRQPANITNSASGTAGDTSTVDYTTRIDMPNVISIVKRNPAGVYVIWFAACPRSVLHTDVFWTVARSYDLDPFGDARAIETETLIQSQDQPVVASQRPWVSNPLPIRNVDDSLVEYMRWLRDLGCPNTI